MIVVYAKSEDDHSLDDFHRLGEHQIPSHKSRVCPTWVQLQVPRLQRLAIEEVDLPLHILHYKTSHFQKFRSHCFDHSKQEGFKNKTYSPAFAMRIHHS